MPSFLSAQLLRTWPNGCAMSLRTATRSKSGNPKTIRPYTRNSRTDCFACACCHDCANGHETLSSNYCPSSQLSIILHILQGGTICRACHKSGEESPDRKGRPAAEIADGSNLLPAVTENDCLRVFPEAMVKMWGKSPRRSAAMYCGYGTRACKTKYTDR